MAQDKQDVIVAQDKYDVIVAQDKYDVIMAQDKNNSEVGRKNVEQDFEQDQR